MKSQEKINLASDNCAPTHPLILQAIIEANEGFASSYGSDPWTYEAEQLIQEAFGKSCKVFFVTTGTGANIFALRLMCQRHESVICTDITHLQRQESGAVEALVGCKLLTVGHRKGKITPEELLRKLKDERMSGKHSTFPRILSVTQPTEIGTVYTLEELACLSKVCKEENLLFHIDGSRFYNAAVRLDVSLNEMISSIQLDVLSLGGTKNGLMSAESLIIFNSDLEDGSDYLQKQTLQLLSKMRYLSAQYIPFFKNDLWRSLAAHANQKAEELVSIIKDIPQFSLSCPVETNQIFFTAPPSWIPLIQEKISCYLWNLGKSEIRFITSWNTSEQDIKNVRMILREISEKTV